MLLAKPAAMELPPFTFIVKSGWMTEKTLRRMLKVRDLQSLVSAAADIGRIARDIGSSKRPSGRSRRPQLASATPISLFARRLLNERRQREAALGADMFADPAWDMLLDLFATQVEGTSVSVSSLCIAAAVPSTTALRWIRAMTERGMLVRHQDPLDGRRVWVELTPDTFDQMNELLGSWMEESD